jgi:hypothetical protein
MLQRLLYGSIRETAGAPVRQTRSGGKSLRKESTVFSLDGWSKMEWLTMTGWTVELSGVSGHVCGVATREMDGVILELSGEAANCEELAWLLIELAAGELERCQDPQKAAVAA